MYPTTPQETMVSACMVLLSRESPSRVLPGIVGQPIVLEWIAQGVAPGIAQDRIALGIVPGIAQGFVETPNKLDPTLLMDIVRV